MLIPKWATRLSLNLRKFMLDFLPALLSKWIILSGCFFVWVMGSSHCVLLDTGTQVRTLIHSWGSMRHVSTLCFGNCIFLPYFLNVSIQQVWALQKTSPLIFCLFWSHPQLFFGLTPDSLLWDYFWWCWGPYAVPGSNQVWLHARQVL